MDEREFEQRAEQALEDLEDALSDLDGVEVDLGGGILTLEFEEGPKVVVNSHATARQIWLAANLAAAHFSWDGQTARWFDSRSGEDLWDRLEAILSERLGRPVKLSR